MASESPGKDCSLILRYMNPLREVSIGAKSRTFPTAVRSAVLFLGRVPQEDCVTSHKRVCEGGLF